MTRVCGWLDFSLKEARWRTPKRCCSSVTTSARLGRSTSLEISAWVPMTKSTIPSAIRSLMSRFSLAVIDPHSSPRRIPSGSSSLDRP